MKVLVTGASGAFGTPLCEALVAADVDVIGLARRRPVSFPAGAEFIAADIRDADAVDAAVAKADRVVHLAWLVGLERDPTLADGINLGGTRNVIAAAKGHGIEKLIFSSSVMAYGASATHGPYKEDDERRPNPEYQYALHKMIAEDELASCGIPTAIVRPCFVIGRHVSSASVGILAAPVLFGVRKENHPSQFVHQDDVMRFLMAVTTGERSGLVNLADGATASLERVGELVGRRVVRAPAGLLRRNMDLAFRLGVSGVNGDALDILRAFPVADVTRLYDTWGFRPTWSMTDALRDTRRAIAGINLLGTKQLRRRDSPVLPPVGGAPGDAARLSASVVSVVHRSLPADTPLTTDLLSRAAGGWARREKHDNRRVLRWAQTETALLLGSAVPSGSAAQGSVGVEATAARAHQLGDLLVDLVALAQDEPGVAPQVEAAAHAVSDLVTQLAGSLGNASPWSVPLPQIVHAARLAPHGWA